METKITKQFKNPFLHREEFAMEIKSNVSPSSADVKKEIGQNEELTVVKRIDGNFGKHGFNAVAVVYDSKENKDKIEKISRKARRKIAEEAKKAVAQPAA